ncbi:MAG TPA: DUF4013 domain-containing protein [Anaerolineaceae bacterium]|nr:DUF4013 domain-containing protein [Anaerolineaceae bacterium]
MTATFATDNLQASFSFPFKDPEWQGKLILAALLALSGFLIVPTILLNGYFARIMRRIVDGDGQAALPAWDDWEALMTDGLRLSVISLIFSLPLLLLMGLGYIAMMGPSVIISLQEGIHESGGVLLLMMALMLSGFFLMGVGLLIGFLCLGILPPAMLHGVSHASIGAAFHVREWWPVFRANLGGFLLMYVFALGLYYVSLVAVQFISMTIVLCLPAYLAWFAVLAYGGVVFSALFAQVYREGRQKLSLAN